MRDNVKESHICPTVGIVDIGLSTDKFAIYPIMTNISQQQGNIVIWVGMGDYLGPRVSGHGTYIRHVCHSHCVVPSAFLIKFNYKLNGCVVNDFDSVRQYCSMRWTP